MAAAQLIGPGADLREGLALTIIKEHALEARVETQPREARKDCGDCIGWQEMQTAAKYIGAGADTDQRDFRTLAIAERGGVHRDRIPNDSGLRSRETLLREEALRRIRAVDLEWLLLARIALDE